jgi:hypothetical protein
MRSKTTIGTRIWLVVGLCLGVGGTATGVLTYALRATSASYQETLRNLQESARRQDAARVVQVTFKKQVQEWKDVLLRGQDPEALSRYSGQFHAAAAQVRELGSALLASVADPEAHRTTEEFLQAHAAMGQKYEAALRAFTAAKGANPHEIDALVKGQDRAATDLIDKVVDALVKRAAAAVDLEKEAVARGIWVASLGVLAAFAGIAAVAGLTVRRISGPLQHVVASLSETAGRLASVAGQVSASSQSLAHGASQEAGAVNATSASSEQINAMALKNSENSRAAAALVMQSQQKFAQTNQCLDQMVVAMGDIRTQSDKVARIIRVIDEIAFQTNILALNAAVENFPIQDDPETRIDSNTR